MSPRTAGKGRTKEAKDWIFGLCAYLVEPDIWTIIMPSMTERGSYRRASGELCIQSPSRQNKGRLAEAQLAIGLSDVMICFHPGSFDLEDEAITGEPLTRAKLDCSST